MTGDSVQARSGEADVQEEMPEPQVECAAAGPVHDERQQDDGQDDHDHPGAASGSRAPARSMSP
jgi:hypothetical protein